MRVRRSTKIAVLCAAPVFGYLGLQASQREPELRVDGPVLVCDEPTHDFGTVWSDARLRHTFKIRNVGNKTGWFEMFIGCSCTYRRAPFRIDPGETTYLPIELRTKKFRGRFQKYVHIRAVMPPAAQVCPTCLETYDSPRYVVRCGVPSIIRQPAKFTDASVFAIRSLFRYL